MIIGLEGLPRSGKSYNAIRQHLIPAVQRGREVITNVAGTNHEAIAEVSGVPLEQVRALVHVITDDQVPDLVDMVKAHALVIIDECHLFFPVKRTQLDAKLVRFFSMHGHYNLDIVLMTQAFSEVHRTVHNRVERKNIYIKKSVIGKDKEFHCTYLHKVPGEKIKFAEVTTKSEAYEEKYFACYKSFEGDGGDGYEVYKEGGQSFWNWKTRLIAALAVAVVGGGLIYFCLFFTKYSPLVQKPKEEKAAATYVSGDGVERNAANGLPVKTVVSPSALPKVPEQKVKAPVEAQVDSETAVVLDFNKAARPRLLGYIQSEGRAPTGAIEWRYGREQVFALLTFKDLASLGWSVAVDGGIARLSRGKTSLIVTSWPVDNRGSLSNSTRTRIRELGGASDEVGTAAPASPGEITIEGSSNSAQGSQPRIGTNYEGIAG